jgi:hypothetical protein
MHGWHYERNHSVISFNFDGGLEHGDLLITVPDCDEFVEKIHPFQGVHGPQVRLKIPAESVIQLVFMFFIAPRVVSMFEGNVAGWFRELTGKLTAWGEKRPS